MKLKIILLIYLFLIIATLFEFTNGMPRRKSCGNVLAERIKFACENRGGYAGHSDGAGHSRRKRGVVDDCCLKPCSDSILYDYCRYSYEITSGSAEHKSAIRERNVQNADEIVLTETGRDKVHKDVPIKYKFEKIEIGTVSPEFNFKKVMMHRTNKKQF
uniref:Putative insulin-like growth factor i-a n=1 Tax=Corethrella appendiculata TaxID=1370023 RepID=U5EMD0_9DIPT